MYNERELIGKRSQLFRRLMKLRGILPGSFSVRKLPCGKPNCICKREGKLHTGYQHSYSIDPKQKPKTKMIPKGLSKQVEKQVGANKEFKKIMKQIHMINLEMLANQIKNKRR